MELDYNNHLVPKVIEDARGGQSINTGFLTKSLIHYGVDA
jgi:hypothetical protein